MSAERTSRRLVRLYPCAWRARYGEELEALIVARSDGSRVPWRTRIDVVLAAGREHAHELRAGGAGRPAAERARAGALLVLWAWMLFVCAGVAVQKVSEHWQGATPPAGRSLPAAAFQGLVIAAGLGSFLVVAGVAVTLPRVASFLRAGGFREIRGSVARSAAITLVATAAAGGLAIWAHRLTAYERNGHDAAHGAAFLAAAALGAVALASWVATAGAVARRLDLPASTLRLEARAAAGVTIAMGAMTIATALWWRGIAHAAPWFLAGRPTGTSSAAFPPAVVVATATMLIATALGAVGARRALRASGASVREHRA